MLKSKRCNSVMSMQSNMNRISQGIRDEKKTGISSALESINLTKHSCTINSCMVGSVAQIQVMSECLIGVSSHLLHFSTNQILISLVEFVVNRGEVEYQGH